MAAQQRLGPQVPDLDAVLKHAHEHMAADGRRPCGIAAVIDAHAAVIADHALGVGEFVHRDNWPLRAARSPAYARYANLGILRFAVDGRAAITYRLYLCELSDSRKKKAAEYGVQHAKIIMSEVTITSDQTKINFDSVHQFLSNIYWSRNIPRDTLERAAKNSICFGALSGDSQVGFARVITDTTTFAFLADVYVLESHRGQGISRKLMGAVFSHPELQGIRRFLLSTRDAHGLYEKYGFMPLAAPERFMEIHKPDIYASSSMQGGGPISK